MKSILQDVKMCYFCGTCRNLEEHHIYAGALRGVSERNGFKVWLCHTCHNEPPFGVHFCEERNIMLKRKCQIEYERGHSREEFIRLIGKNYR